MYETIKCKEHQNNADFYCRSKPDCMVAYSVLCCGINHVGHDFANIKDPSLPDKIAQDLEDLVRMHEESQKTTSDNYQALRKELLDIQENSKATVKQVENFFSEIRELLKEKEKSLVNQVQEEACKLYQVLNQELSLCESCLQNQKKTLKQLLDFKAYFDQLESEQKITASYSLYQKYPLESKYSKNKHYFLKSRFTYDESFPSSVDKCCKLKLQKAQDQKVTQSSLYFFKEFSKYIYKYNIVQDNWTSVPMLQIPRFHNLNVVFVPETNLYILIGCTGQKDKLIHFYPDKPEITEKDLDFVYPQWGCAIYYWGEMHLIGGEVEDSSSAECRVYNIQEGTWRNAPSLLIPTDSASAIGFEDSIYVFGGYTNNYSLKAIERLQKHSESWELLKAQLPLPLAFIGTVATDSCIVLFGGEYDESNSDQVFRWDGTSQFEKLTKLKEPFTAGSSDTVAYANSLVYIIKAEDSDFPSIEPYEVTSYFEV